MRCRSERFRVPQGTLSACTRNWRHGEAGIHFFVYKSGAECRPSGGTARQSNDRKLDMEKDVDHGRPLQGIYRESSFAGVGRLLDG